MTILDLPALTARVLFENLLPKADSLYGRMDEELVGKPIYVTYNFLFGWTDQNWDRGLRNRCFLFIPRYFSARCMTWRLWWGEFADRGCVLGTREEVERG